jgi:hypothetical protein
LINPFDFAQGDGKKRLSLKIKSAKTTSKRRSAARAVRPSSSTRGLLPLCFFVVFHAFYLRAVARISKHRTLLFTIHFSQLTFHPNLCHADEGSIPTSCSHQHIFILAVGDFFSCLFFSFALMQKKQKIKP